MDALRLPPGDADVTTLSGGERRRVALCRLLLSPARPAAARRAHQPPRRRDGRPGSSATCADYPGTVVAVTHDRYFLDNVAGWILELDRGTRHPVRGQLLELARAEAGAPRARGEARTRPASARSSASSSGCAWRPKARQAKGKARLAAYEKLLAEAEERRRRARRARDPASRPAPRLGDAVIEVDDVRKGYGDRLLIEDLSFTLPPAGIVGVIGAERRRQDDAAPDDHGRGAARRRHAHGRSTASSSPTSTSRATTSTREDGLRGDHRRRRVMKSATARSTAAPTCAASTSRAPTSRSRSASSPAASATGCTWPSSCKAGGTSSCSTSRPTISTSTPCARSRRPCWRSPAAR